MNLHIINKYMSSQHPSKIGTLYHIANLLSLSISPQSFLKGCFKIWDMASSSSARFAYQRLRDEGAVYDDSYEDQIIRDQMRVIGGGRGPRISWSFRLKKRRLKVRIPSLKKLLRRKARLVMGSWAKVLKRLKESQSHFGDLFAGNYLFMQVTPTPFKCVQEKYSVKGLDLGGFPSSRYSLPPRVSY